MKFKLLYLFEIYVGKDVVPAGAAAPASPDDAAFDVGGGDVAQPLEGLFVEIAVDRMEVFRMKHAVDLKMLKGVKLCACNDPGDGFDNPLVDQGGHAGGPEFVPRGLLHDNPDAGQNVGGYIVPRQGWVVTLLY